LGHAAEKEHVPKLARDVEKFKERRDLAITSVVKTHTTKREENSLRRI